MSLNCFVAMAIGVQDTDRLYSRDIKKALKPLGIDARRVDQVEHNNNIDSQIMTMLAECDLAVVDLTYVRPSVYFERKVTAPILRRLANDTARQAEEQAFARLSPTHQVKALRFHALKVLVGNRMGAATSWRLFG